MDHNAPRQPRSEVTFERIVTAAERLYRLRRSVEVSVREVCEEAGASRSSFYARFPAAEALVHVCYDRFQGRVETLCTEIERDWPTERPGGKDFAAFTEFLVARFVSFWHAEARLVQAFRAGEAADLKLRDQRQELDRLLILRTREIVARLYPGLDLQAFAAAIERDLTLLSAAFRTALDFPEQLVSGPERPPDDVVSSLTGLVLRSVGAAA